MIKFDRAIGGYYGADNVFGKVSVLNFLENRIVLEIRDKTKEDAVSIETSFEGMNFFTFQVGFIGNDIVYDGDVILSPDNKRYYVYQGEEDTVSLEPLDEDFESLSTGDDSNYSQEDFNLHYSEYKMLGNIERLKVQKEKDANNEDMSFDMAVFKNQDIDSNWVYYYTGNDKETESIDLIHATFDGTEVFSNSVGYVRITLPYAEFQQQVQNGSFVKVSKEEFENYKIGMQTFQ